MRQVICLFVYNGNCLFTLEKIPGLRRFWAVTSNLHTRLAIVTEYELGLAFPPRNLTKNFVQIRPRFI